MCLPIPPSGPEVGCAERRPKIHGPTRAGIIPNAPPEPKRPLARATGGLARQTARASSRPPTTRWSVGHVSRLSAPKSWRAWASRNPPSSGPVTMGKPAEAGSRTLAGPADRLQPQRPADTVQVEEHSVRRPPPHHPSRWGAQAPARRRGSPAFHSVDLVEVPQICREPRPGAFGMPVHGAKGLFFLLPRVACHHDLGGGTPRHSRVFRLAARVRTRSTRGSRPREWRRYLPKSNR